MSEIEPLKSLEELLGFERPVLCAVETLRPIKRGKPGDPKNLFCHDMACYQEDRFIYGSHKPGSYNFHHWQTIDTFVYCSDHMVTIPPPGWITAAHKHGVKVLGTFMLESTEGAKAMNRIENDGLVSRVASQLALVATKYRFDGWFVRVATRTDTGAENFVDKLLTAITKEMHHAVPGSAVICQNSILQDGKLEPQSELNDDNWCLFELCDGIVLNCRWDESHLRKSAAMAGKRKGDIYAGVDVLARNTSYKGGYDMYKAVTIAREYGLSAAIFGAEWAYEQEDKTYFRENQCVLWALPDECCSQWCITTLPLSTTFCQGFGASLYKQGLDVRSAPWFNLSRQQLQPRDQGRKLCGGGGSAMVHTLDSYAGGGCLCLEYDPKEAPGLRIVPYFRLFGFDLPLGSLCVSYTYKSKEQSCPAGHGINLVLKVKDDAGKTEELSLSSIITVAQGGNYIVERSVDSSAQGDQGITENGWLTRFV
ncbi:hypothetical protein HPB50_017150 [Hyalomma asiaticum]|uniref:Uncharacterized protein n=1 Tax=Hyalomma asiaticum TaxID=266040 RepID=A0ACB7T8C5_HYAAI|nr:hypothetical protein HPB50_017150 [Hyalomma asiaticum]